MRERVSAIILAVLVSLGAVMISILEGTLLPASFTVVTAVAFFTLGRQQPKKPAKKKLDYSDRNYQRYLEWRAGRD